MPLSVTRERMGKRVAWDVLASRRRAHDSARGAALVAVRVAVLHRGHSVTPKQHSDVEIGGGATPNWGALTAALRPHPPTEDAARRRLSRVSRRLLQEGW